MLTRVTPDLPQPTPPAQAPPNPTLADRVSQIATDIQGLRNDHLNLIEALAVAFAVLNLDGALSIAGATIDASPIGATAPSTGAFTTVAVGGDTAVGHLSSGTYTPTLTGVANLTAITAYACQYLRAGNTIHVSGKFDADPVAAGATKFGLSLPVASALTAAEQAGGAAVSPGVAGLSAAIYADATNDRAQVEWVAVDTANRSWFFSFTYQVL